jgi:serine/threonine protein kinase
MHEEPTADNARQAPAPPPPPLAPKHALGPAAGAEIGPYKIITQLGEGGFGSVYLAEQSAPVQRRVALKLIKPGMDSRLVMARFEAERQVLALMDHPSVAKVFDAGLTPEGRPFFVMELVRGEPITRFCELERVNVEDRVRLMMKVCGAVQHAHMKGVLHRDLKPSNILVSLVDGEPLPKVIDFGVAKALHQRLSESTIYTEMGQMIGTPEYMSPEQARGSADVDTRADIYALGAILYELLSGVPPLDVGARRKEGQAALERTIEQEHPPAPSVRLSELAKSGQFAAFRGIDAPTALRRVRGDLDWIVLKCLEKERSRRYSSAAALAEDLERYLQDDPVLAGPPSATYRAAKFIKRHRVAVIASALVLLSLVGGIIGTTYGLARAKQETAAAERARDESEAVTSFLIKMIESVDPDEAGRDVTVRAALDQSSKDLHKSFADRPLVEARVRHALGISYWQLGFLEQADEHLPAVVDLRRKALGPEHRDTLRALANVGGLRLEQGRFAEAEEILKEAVEGFTTTLGPGHGLTLGVASNLAVLYSRRGADQEALEMSRRVYEGQKIARGPDHEQTLGALINLGDQLSEMGRMDEAEPLLKEAVERWERAHGQEKTGTLIALHSWGMHKKNQGKFDEAEAIIRRVIDARSRILGEQHVDTLTAIGNLGVILTSKKQMIEAEAALTRAWTGMRNTLGDGHPTTLRVLNLLSTNLEEQGWPERSRPVIEQIIHSARTLAREPDIGPGDLNDLAHALLHMQPAEQQDVNTALALAKRACEVERARGGRDLWRFLDTLAAAQHAARDSAAALSTQRECIRLIPPSGEAYRGELEQRAFEYEQAAAVSGSK